MERDDVDPLCRAAVSPNPMDAVQHITLSRTENEPSVFAADVCLDRLLPPQTSGTDLCELTIVLRGLEKPEHPLSGSRRRMPPLTLRVEHEPIPLEPSAASHALQRRPQTDGRREATRLPWNDGPFADDVHPPGEEDSVPLDAKFFQIDADWADAATKSLELKPEGTAITVSLPPKDRPRPPAGKNYRPGRLEFSLMEDGKPRRRLIVPVELQLDLIPIRFSGPPETLSRSDIPQASGPLKLAVVKPGDAKHVTDLKVVLRPSSPDSEKVGSRLPSRKRNCGFNRPTAWHRWVSSSANSSSR